MNSRDKHTASIDKRNHVNKCEAEGFIADSMSVRMELMAQVRSGEKTLEEVQNELKKIKRDAKKNGKITKNQAFSRG
jgi:hypothetical protein